MRRRLMLGLGLTGLLAGSSAGQFGAPAAPPTPAPFGGGTPIGTPSIPTRPQPAVPTPTQRMGSYIAPIGGFPAAPPTAPANSFQPVGVAAAVRAIKPVEIESALGPNHPLAVKPEDGNYFICVKSYSRPHHPGPTEQGYTVRQLGEALADDIQKSHRTRVFLFELISDEKRAEARARTVARQRAAMLAASVAEIRKKSELQGMEFQGFDDPKLKFQTFHYRDQVAVLVGGYQTEDEAVKALAEIKKWPVPRDPRLMDAASIATRTSKTSIRLDKKYIHPYATAMVVQNPTIVREMGQQGPELDAYTMKLNENRPYSLLQTTKGWTIAVQKFSAPVQYLSKDARQPMVKRKGSSAGDILLAGEQQAEELAKALREMKGPPTPAYPGGVPLHLDAYVLHTRFASLVTVGQFDSPHDPELLEKQRILSNMKFNMSRDARGFQITGADQKLFAERLQPVPIPRH